MATGILVYGIPGKHHGTPKKHLDKTKGQVVCLVCRQQGRAGPVGQGVACSNDPRADVAPHWGVSIAAELAINKTNDLSPCLTELAIDPHARHPLVWPVNPELENSQVAQGETASGPEVP